MLIQKMRLKRGWSQEQLAEISGLSVRTVQRLERGQPGSLETLNTLAAVFEVDLDQLKEPEMDTPHFAEAAAGGRNPNVRPDEALAFAHVRKVKAFYIHLTQYLVIISVLVAVNLVTSPQYLWAVWPAFGWGLGVLAHGASVFNFIPFLGGDWEKRQVEKYLGREL